MKIRNIFELIKKIPWNNNIKTRSRILIFIVCSILLIGAILWSKYLFALNNFTETRWSIILCSIIIPFSFIFILSLLDWKNKLVKNILLLVLGIIIGSLSVAVIVQSSIRIMTIIFIISMICFFIYRILENVFLTIFTFIFSFFLSMSIILYLVVFLSQKASVFIFLDSAFGIYLAAILSVVIYKCIGRRINVILLNFFGNNNASNNYDENHFKNLLNLIYLILFIIINSSFYLGKINDIYFNLINNTYLTLLAIININWSNILINHESDLKSKY